MNFKEYFNTTITASAGTTFVELLDIAKTTIGTAEAVDFVEVDGCVLNKDSVTFNGVGIAKYIRIYSTTATPDEFALYSLEYGVNLSLGSLSFGIGEIKLCFDNCKSTFHNCNKC